MLKILVLICPMSVDHMHCDRSNALEMVREMEVSSAQQCGFLGQAMIAPTVSNLVPDPSKAYLKVMCLRQQVASQ